MLIINKGTHLLGYRGGIMMTGIGPLEKAIYTDPHQSVDNRVRSFVWRATCAGGEWEKRSARIHF